MLAPITGHVLLIRRKRGGQFSVKYRLPGGRQVKKRLGPAHTGKGRPPTGHFTRKTAEEALDAILTDLRRGTVQSAPKTGATFADAVPNGCAMSSATASAGLRHWSATGQPWRITCSPSSVTRASKRSPANGSMPTVPDWWPRAS